MIIKKGKRKYLVRARKLSSVGKFTGLMFSTRQKENLLFEFRRETTTPIHSWFVFYPFLAVWLDRKNNVVETRIVEPFSTVVRPRAPFRRLVELPCNDGNMKLIKMLVGEERFKYNFDFV